MISDVEIDFRSLAVSLGVDQRRAGKLMSVLMTHQITGEQRLTPTGFSWTTLFFGPFPALFRGDLLWAMIMAGVAVLTVGFAWLVWPFVYNGIHQRRLCDKGFRYQAHAQPAFAQPSISVNVGTVHHGAG